MVVQVAAAYGAARFQSERSKRQGAEGRRCDRRHKFRYKKRQGRARLVRHRAGRLPAAGVFLAPCRQARADGSGVPCAVVATLDGYVQTSEDVVPFSSTGMTKFSCRDAQEYTYGIATTPRTQQLLTDVAVDLVPLDGQVGVRWTAGSSQQQRVAVGRAYRVVANEVVGCARRRPRWMKMWSLAEPTGPSSMASNRPS